MGYKTWEMDLHLFQIILVQILRTQDLKISKSLGISSLLLQMDGSSVFSSVELRLGHPSQQSKKLGTLATQTFEYHYIVKTIEYQQPLFPEPLMHKGLV